MAGTFRDSRLSVKWRNCSPAERILIDDSSWRLTPSGPGLEVHEHRVRLLAPAAIYGGPEGGGPAS